MSGGGVGNPSRLDEFAELLSQDVPLRAIAERMGLAGTHTANAYVQRLHRELGWQAS